MDSATNNGMKKPLWQENHKVLRKILDTLIEHVVYHDMEMRVLWANRAACQSVNLDREQVLGRHCYEIWPKRSRPCENCPVSLSRQTRLPQSFEMHTPDGRSWHISAAPVFNTGGRIIGMVEMTLDISPRVKATEALKKVHDEQEQIIRERTHDLMSLNEKLRQEIEERKRSETALRQQKDLIQQLALELSGAEDRERQRLAGVLHDDLQQMLAYLKIQLTTECPHEVAQEKVDHLSGLVDKCIDHCRNLAHELNPPILKKKDFASALKWLCRQMKDRYALTVHLQTMPGLEITSKVLSSMLIRSIRELLFNVVKHSGTQYATIATRHKAEWILVTVEDSGKGCDPALLKLKQHRQDVFGLFNIEDRIRFLGGRVQIESAPGRGFRVTLSVPMNVSFDSSRMQALPEAAAAPVKCKPARPDDTVVHDEGKAVIRVLIADDHELLRVGLSKLLQAQDGILVAGTAADGREAVQLAIELNPDVILMDISMPIMNGIKATEEICAQRPNIRVIGLTIHEDPDIRQTMLDAGARTCLLKTGSQDELIRQIRLAPTRGRLPL